MAYQITTTQGAPIATVQDATINTAALSITLIGRDYAGYGAFLNENAVHMLENFANDVLLNNLEDWWNNDGGFGDLCICIPSGQYSIYNHIRYYDTEDYMHDGNLFEKTED